MDWKFGGRGRLSEDQSGGEVMESRDSVGQEAKAIPISLSGPRRERPSLARIAQW